MARSRKAEHLKPEEMLQELAMRASRQANPRTANINRYQPMPQQEAFHKSQKKNRIASGGNRGGKTFSTTADDVLILTRKHPWRAHMYPPMGEQIRMRFIGVDFDRGIEQTALPLFAQFLPPSFLINGSWEDSYRSSNHMLTLDDGAKSTVSFMSYEQDADKFQAVSLHHIHFDEEPPKPIWDESMLRVLDTGGSWTLSETPVQQSEWIQDELVDPGVAGLLENVDVFFFDTRMNVHLSAEALQEISVGLSAEEQIVRLAGQYTNAALVFPEFTLKWPSVIPQEAFRLTEDWALYESMDHGYVNPTAWLWTAVHPDGRIITFDSLYGAGIIVDEWAAAVKKKRAEIAERFGLRPDELAELTATTIGDPAIGDQGNATAQTGITIQQAYAQNGVYIATEGIRRARAGQQNIGLDKMHRYLRPRPLWHPEQPGEPWWQITENNGQLIREMKRARKPKQSTANRERQNPSEQIRDKDNHAIDAAKYLFMLTHDLRPEQYREDDEADFRALASQYMRPSQAPPTTHDEAFRATSVAGIRYDDSDFYPAME